MDLEELRRKRAALEENTAITQSNMGKIATESERVAEVADNSRMILEDLDREFEAQTGLDGNDIKFLFAAAGLQLARIVIVNQMTEIEPAGNKNKKEKRLHEFQKEQLSKFDPGEDVHEKLYYASMENIISARSVPYDTQQFLTKSNIKRISEKKRLWDFDIGELILEKKLDLFKGGDHRFATLGHDPLLGLIFGTGNIMTNTITCVKMPAVIGVAFPMLTTNHVVYTSNHSHPYIATYGSTSVMLSKFIERAQEQPAAFVAALIKQIIHIGTDIYTPCGIQIPGANLLLTNTEVERITKNGLTISAEKMKKYFPDIKDIPIHISSGDLAKIGMSASFAGLINLLISTLHALMYDTSMAITREMYEVRTRKIIMYSNAIATGSNLLWEGVQVMSGTSEAVRKMDLGGLMVTLNRLTNDPVFIRKVKEEFIFGEFKKQIAGKELDLQEPHW